MKIDEITASCDRVKVSLGAASRPQRAAQGGKLWTLEIHENLWNLMKSLEIHKNQ